MKVCTGLMRKLRDQLLGNVEENEVHSQWKFPVSQVNTLLWPALKYRLQNQLQTTFLTPFLHWKLTKHDFHHCLYCSNNLNLCNIHHLLEQCDMKLVTCRPTFLFYKWNDLLESFSLNLVIINGAEEFSKVYIISLICAFSRQLRSYMLLKIHWQTFKS